MTKLPGNFLIYGDDYLAAHPGFELKGRKEELQRLCAILMRSRANSVLLVAPGGAGASSLCMGLQAYKNTPNPAFSQFHSGKNNGNSEERRR
jgi:hypothetical protein